MSTEEKAVSMDLPLPSISPKAVVEGGCACGAVRFRITGAPVRAGLCHCMTCRKAHAAAYNPFVVYRRDQVVVTGELTTWESSACYERRFCPRCGSRVLGGHTQGGEVELSLGSLDDVGQVEPQYESWTIRREPWLPGLEVPQNDRDRNPAE
jgi:hypothetical protein